MSLHRSSHLFSAETFNIGAAAANRPNKIYAKTALFVAGDDGTGLANTVCFTNVTAAPDAGTTLLASPPTGIAVTQSGWLKIWVGTTAAYIPFWDA